MLDKRHIRTFLFCMLAATLVWAVPVERRRFLATLVDGSQVMLTSFGDEHLSYFLTDDNMVVELTDSGFVLTDYDQDGYLSLQEPAIAKRTKRYIGNLETAQVAQMGEKHVAVLLVQFPDKLFSVAEDSASVNEYYQRYCNGLPGSSPYTGHGSSGSVSEYFLDQSNGQFQPVFDVIGPMTLDSVYSYYGQDSGSSKDIKYGTFVTESLKKACQVKTDWSLLDNNGDGKVDMVFLLFAGLGQNYTNSYGDKNTIWPKEMPTSYKVSGISFAGCSSTSELRPTAASGGVITASAPDGIGVFCHEFSHALGLPDFYDTNYKTFGMDYWSIMDYGQYAVNSYTPVGYTAYERDFMQWQMLEELKEPCTLRIPCFAKGGHGYKIVNDANANEYYVLENRQGYGWDKLCQTRGHGLLVTHVDYDRSAWSNNRVNTIETHQRMTIIPANNMLKGGNTPGLTSAEWKQSLQGNPYPGITGNHELTDTSTPASVVFTGGFMGKPIYDIEETKDDVIVLKFNPLGTLGEAQNLTTMDVTESEATLTWEPVDGAEAYNIRVTDEFDHLVMQADSIRANNYKVVELDANTTYSLSVQAIADKYRNSEWTAPVMLCLSDYIDGIADNLSESAEPVTVYDMNGIMVTQCKANEICRQRVCSGIYVVKFRNGKVRKMLISR